MNRYYSVITNRIITAYHNNDAVKQQLLVVAELPLQGNPLQAVSAVDLPKTQRVDRLPEHQSLPHDQQARERVRAGLPEPHAAHTPGTGAAQEEGRLAGAGDPRQRADQLPREADRHVQGRGTDPVRPARGGHAGAGGVSGQEWGPRGSQQDHAEGNPRGHEEQTHGRGQAHRGGGEVGRAGQAGLGKARAREVTYRAR